MTQNNNTNFNILTGTTVTAIVILNLVPVSLPARLRLREGHIPDEMGTLVESGGHPLFPAKHFET